MAGGAQQVNLMGPNVSLPPEMQASQAQLQIQQEIAQALIAKSLEAYSPVIHTGGNNPFARDVPNIGGPMAQIANALFGQKQLEDVGPKQQALAQRYQDLSQFEQSEIMRNVTGYDQGVPGPDGQTPVHVPGDVLRAASVKTITPIAQQLKDSLLKAYIENQTKQTPTPGDLGTLTRNDTPESVANSLVPGLFGRQIDARQLRPYQVPMQGPGPISLVDRSKPGGVATAAGTPAQTIIPPVAPGAPFPTSTAGLPGVIPPADAGKLAAAATGATTTPLAPKPDVTGTDSVAKDIADKVTPPTPVINTSGQNATIDAKGQVEYPTTVASKVTGDAITDHIKTLQEGRDAAQQHIDVEPKLIKVLQVLPNADMRMGGDYVTKARKWMISMGVSDDQANKVNDTETFLKTMLSPAAGAGRAFNSRVTQLEFANFLKAFAAEQSTDPRTATNIVQQLILNGHNAYTQHLKNVDQFQSQPGIGPDLAKTYSVSGFPSLGSTLQRMDSANAPIDVRVDKSSGMASLNPLPPGSVGIKGDVNPAMRLDSKGNNPTPPAGAIARLKANANNPKFVSDFDSMFGPGASDEVLGTK